MTLIKKETLLESADLFNLSNISANTHESRQIRAFTVTSALLVFFAQFGLGDKTP